MHVMTDLEISRASADLAKLQAETAKLAAERVKLGQERLKLRMEARKLHRDTIWQPVAIAAGLLGAGGALMGALAGFALLLLKWAGVIA